MRVFIGQKTRAGGKIGKLGNEPHIQQEHHENQGKPKIVTKPLQRNSNDQSFKRNPDHLLSHLEPSLNKKPHMLKINGTDRAINGIRSPERGSTRKLIVLEDQELVTNLCHTTFRS